MTDEKPDIPEPKEPMPRRVAVPQPGVTVPPPPKPPEPLPRRWHGA